jgi:hypothetical protein
MLRMVQENMFIKFLLLEIKFEDESGNEVASRKVVDFYLIDTETLVITDEKTNDWH